MSLSRSMAFPISREEDIGLPQILDNGDPLCTCGEGVIHLKEHDLQLRQYGGGTNLEQWTYAQAINVCFGMIARTLLMRLDLWGNIEFRSNL